MEGWEGEGREGGRGGRREKEKISSRHGTWPLLADPCRRGRRGVTRETLATAGAT